MTARLALIGAPGSGKSTIGRSLAQAWSCQFLDTDEEYLSRFGHPVGEAVIDDEAIFRTREAEVVRDCLHTTGAVVAVGGGAVRAEAVVEALDAVPNVWLEVGLVDAARRTGLSGARPVALGNVRGQLHDMLKQWAQVYGGLADLQVTTDGRDPVDIIEEIMEWEAAL